MIKNTHNVDRILRLVAGLALLGLAWFYMASLGTTLAVVIGIVGVVLLATAAMGWCPLYSLLGIRTRSTD